VLGDRLGCRRTLLGACLGVGGSTSAFSRAKDCGGCSLQSRTTTGEGILVGVVYATLAGALMNLSPTHGGRHPIPHGPNIGEDAGAYVRRRRPNVCSPRPAEQAVDLELRAGYTLGW